MTSDEIIKKNGNRNCKKEADQKEKENIKKEAVAKARKIRAVQKKKTKENSVKKIKSNPKL